jgi:peptide/nickel transport system substrate-binding protein
MPNLSPAFPQEAAPASSRPMRRRLLAALLLLPLAVPAQAQERTLHVVAPWDIRGLDPVRSGFVFQRLSIAETLVVPDREGHLLPGLAAPWSVSEDGLDWRFPIRPGAMFHDGTPVTAAAVANALNIVRQTPASALRLIPTDGFKADGEAVTARLSRPFAVLPAYLADSTAVILAPASYDDSGHTQRIIGSGKYRVTRIDGSLVVESDAVKPVSEGGPAIRHVQYRAVPDGETRARMSEAGDADISFNLQPVAADRLRRNPTLEILSLPIPRARFVALNTTLPGLSDPSVRKALSLAIDRDGAARTILRNPASSADQLLPPFLAEWRNPTVEKLHFDPDEARRLLDAAGWKPGPDGIRVRDGKRLSFELFAYAARPELPPLAEAIQAQWKDVGVEAKIRLGDSEEIPPMHNNGTLQASMVARNYGILPDPIGTLADDFVASSTVGYGPVGWRSPAIEAAISGYMESSDPAKRAAWRQQITGIIQTEMPVIPLSWYDQIVAVSKRVQGVTIDPFESTYGIADMRWSQ